jgi:hypothetical protein
MDRDKNSAVSNFPVGDSGSPGQRNKIVACPREDYLNVAGSVQNSGQPLGNVQGVRFLGQLLTGYSTSIDAAVPRIDNDHSGMGD